MQLSFGMTFMFASRLLLSCGVASSTFGSPQSSTNFGIPGKDATYDYVIIGGGTAGAALATRLLENSNVTAALVEAGGFYEQENGNQTLVPGYYLSNLNGPLTNWNFTTTPQTQLQNRTFQYARGKALGGSSALNVMAYQRGTIGAYQAWADAVGDQSWTFDNLLPYFQKSANFTLANTQTRAANASVPPPSANAYTTFGGPLHVSYPNTASPISSWGQLGLREIGIPDTEDFSSGSLLGSQYCPMTLRPADQTRSTSESSYLEAAFGRNKLFPYLSVYIHTLGSRILFNGNKTATGVQVKSSGLSYVLSARKEVILSAGAFQSPQLLMVSGIGPRQQLANYNITVISDRPGVGQNMWDHILFPISHAVNVQTLTSTNSDPVLANEAVLAYLPTSYYRNLTAQAQKDLDNFSADWPNFEYIVESFSSANGAGGQPLGTLDPALVSPLSRGTVSIKSSSVDDAPVIDVGWLSNPTDLEMAIVSIKRAREFWASDVMQGVVTGDEVLPGKNVSTDAQLREWAKENVQTVYHCSCTCKMGMVNDTMAVTDSRARVLGVSGLRVVDASTFPLLPPGHPQSTIYALAEKIAHHILQGN